MAKRPSPDSVICIDLTEDDDDQESRLGDVRKALNRSKTTISASSTIDLTEDNDNQESRPSTIDLTEDNDNQESRPRKRTVLDPSTKRKSAPLERKPPATASRAISNEATGKSEEVQENLNPGKRARRFKVEGRAVTPASVQVEGIGGKSEEVEANPEPGKRARRFKVEGRAVTPASVQVEDVEVAEPIKNAMVPVAQKPTASDEDVVVVGAANQLRLPHMRQHCTEFKFDPTPADITGRYNQATLVANSKACDLCYCYVCDLPVKDCTRWHSSPTRGIRRRSGHHCCANDKNTKWVARRARSKDKSANIDVASRQLAASSNSQSSRGLNGTSLRNDSTRRNDTGIPSTAVRHGPFPPDTMAAPRDVSLTKCRKCGWFSRLTHHHPNLPKIREFIKYSSSDWCHQCGRVASERDFGKMQVLEYKPRAGDFYFGKKEIPFRIKSHDPRLFHEYKTNWESADENSPEWVYNEAEMEEDTFRHRLGTHPEIVRILECIPTVSEDKIKKTGLVRKSNVDPRFSQNRAGNTKNPALAEETNAIIIQKQSHIQLFMALYEMVPRREQGITTSDVVAEWDTSSRSGKFTVQLFLPESAFRAQNHEQFSYLLGLWFEIFPLPLPDLGSLMEADHVNVMEYAKIGSTSVDTARAELCEAAKEYNHSRKAINDKLSLVSSSGSHLMGGTSDNDKSLSGLLKRFYRERLPQLISESNIDQGTIAGLCLGSVSIHRRMRTMKNSQLNCRLIGTRTGLAIILGPKDCALACACLQDEARTLQFSRGMQATMARLENIGHEGVDFVEGLNVELLEFQRQSLKWALEREKTPGGIQSYFWAKIPADQDRKQEIYYNPILERFRREKPRLVRGGFIAEEMGLGKTVISLALILKNSAPSLPASGSPIAALDGSSDSDSSDQGWDKDLYKLTSLSNRKRGSILSRGTLVICPVSLVGQWIEEAKSKLTDPGLLYPYHGQNRERDAKILAKNSIVVTTYQVLASDATYHASKGGSNYCAPLEMIRWWRIICDEGHSLRHLQTQRSKAALSLVADHKWLVSGTPLNTSFNDLKNQLKFLGIEDVGDLFRAFEQKSRTHQHTDEARLLFFLRSIMMRHTQNQKYRGTSTTLMSLPEKTERKVEVTCSQAEKAEYSRMEKQAQDFYVDFRARHFQNITKHFLKLSQKLTPLRVACSGGKYPISGCDDDDNGDVTEADDLDQTTQKKKKKVVKYSDFAFTSKFIVLLAELERIRDDDPSSKSLVFSQFTSTLRWLQEELPKHGFQFRTLSGDMTMKQRANALRDFQSDPPTTIFLLSMRAGAVGINLTEANRVFLMEPSLNPALEHQAIGRVHRLGQKRSVEIVRLVMKDSVESRLLKFLETKYGKSSNGSSGDNSEGDEEGAAKEVQLGLVGNVMTDRAQIMMDEFDLLFGVKSLNVEENDPPSPDHVADQVMSSGFI